MRHQLATTAATSIVALAPAGCAIHGRSYPKTSSSSKPSVRLTPRRAVVRFAQTYGEYLDGRRPAARVAEASTIDVGIRIAPDARAGRLQVTSVAPAPLGGPSAFVLRDRTLTIRFTVTIEARESLLIAYARVSTDLQHLDLQLDALAAAGSERAYRDTGSGSLKHRPELDACLDYLHARGLAT